MSLGATTSFRRTYAEARALFLERAHARGAIVESHLHPTERGAAGETLAIDTALVGDPNAAALLLLTSGTHGVEGFCGSACQAALLQDDAFVAAAQGAGIAVLLVHALNPYGFAHLRRVNEDNVDLNRNFRHFARPAPRNDLYGELDPILIPQEWPPTAENHAALAAVVAKHGMTVLQQVVSGGQYSHPDGMFYGGSAPTWSHLTLRALLRRHGAARARLGWIDFHTGLGPAGHGEKIFAGRNDSQEVARARQWWGAEVTSFHEGSSTSAALEGPLYLAAYEECPAAEYTGIALEFGTVPLPEVFAALRGDHWLYRHPEASMELRRAIEERMRSAFDVDSPEWQAAVVEQARAAALAAIAGLQ